VALRVPSLHKNYETHFSGDPALYQLPKNASQEEADAYSDRIRVARETGNWSSLIVEGRVPTTFVMRVIPQKILFTLRDAARAGEFGEEMFAAWLFRAAVRSISNFDEGQAYKFDIVDTKYGKEFASDEVIRINEVAPGVIRELAAEAHTRASDLTPKS
jgi:hypothetical protein